eukprot:Nitzschia sp. Nitz4//scaffold37_size175936//127359//131135//NITZ4_002059-RA/size175936-augustus-gene-0.20-mRNA-1//-1//CDS//3329549827//8316//frame0
MASDETPSSLQRAPSESNLSSASSASVLSNGSGFDEESVQDSYSFGGIFYLRAIVLSSTIVAAIVVASSVYMVTHRQEQADYEDSFQVQAVVFLDAVNSKIGPTIHALEVLAVSVSSYARDQGLTWPYVTLPDFHAKALPLLQSTSAKAIMFLPLIPLEDRPSWEEYSVDHRGWVDEGLSYESSLGIDNDVYSSSNSSGSIFGLSSTDHDDAIQEEDADALYLPVWQHSPVLPSIINYNILSSEIFFDPATKCLNQTEAILGESTELDLSIPSSLNGNLGGNASSTDPVAFVYFPVVESLLPTPGDVVGVVLAVVEWASYFTAILTKDSGELVVVLENGCHESRTFRVLGNDVQFDGVGDLHDTRYSHLGVTINIALERIGIQLDGTHCPYTLTAYPSAASVEASMTGRPIRYSLVVGLVFMFAFCLLSIYDNRVQKRHRAVEKAAFQNRRIVDSLFPPAIRERMFRRSFGNLNETNPAPEKLTRQRSFLSMSGRPVGRRFPRRGSNADGSEAGSRKSTGTSRKGSTKEKTTPDACVSDDEKLVAVDRDDTEFEVDSTPIADVFPEATVFFADIAGFTAWSSQREPTQVFTLLQTVYQSFDRIGKKLGVFKIETIGDCYLAVTGLPDAQPDHAVRMARFARECLSRMQRLVQKLEVTLGPGTGDLAIRVGLHSGAVTAGVLRGEKSRFQLFGDTVNTASRMESTGQRDKIQCSAATAHLLRVGNKGGWLVEREDFVIAKGLGQLRTYWVVGRNQNTPGSNGLRESEHTVFDDDGLDRPSEHRPPRSQRGISRGFRGDFESNEGSRCKNHSLNRSTHSEMSDCWSSEDERPKSSKRTPIRNENTRQKRLIEWNVDILRKLLVEVNSHRTHVGDIGTEITDTQDWHTTFTETVAVESIQFLRCDKTNPRVCSETDLPPVVESQLRDFVSTVAKMYRSNEFHSFDHASQVAMSTNKLLNRMQSDLPFVTIIKTQPLARFTLALAALIQDVDHPGCENPDLMRKDRELANAYEGRSVSEHNSFDVAWELLMDPAFEDLQRCIYHTFEEYIFFRQLLVNLVLATDVSDVQRIEFSKERWNRAFMHADTQHGSDELNNLRATLVLENVLQVSDVSYAMQHWHIFQKWNSKLFDEHIHAFKQGLATTDPGITWYAKRLFQFESHIVPLAERLVGSSAFGATAKEYLGYAKQNKAEWELQGKHVVKNATTGGVQKGPLATLLAKANKIEEEEETSSFFSGAIE